LENLRKLEDINEKIADGALNDAEKGFTSSSNSLMIIVAVLLLAGFFGSMAIISWALRPLGALTKGWEGNVEQVSSMTSQISSTTLQLGTSLKDSAGTLQKASLSMEQMLSLIQHQGQEATRVKNLVDETRVSLASSEESAGRTRDYVKSLNENAERVFQVVKTIEEIAFQTNILALNAGVEAVRAGEQGKEFVMVVEEIRNLSQRCSQVARETSQLVTVNAQQAQEGLKLSEATGKVIAQTAEKAKKVVDLITVIEEGVEEQSSGLQAIRASVTQSERETYQNSAAGEKLSATGFNLSQQVDHLKAVSKQMITLFQGGAKELKKAVPAKSPVPASSSVPVESAPSLDKLGINQELDLAEKTGTDGAKVIRMNK